MTTSPHREKLLVRRFRSIYADTLIISEPNAKFLRYIFFFVGKTRQKKKNSVIKACLHRWDWLLRAATATVHLIKQYDYVYPSSASTFSRFILPRTNVSVVYFWVGICCFVFKLFIFSQLVNRGGPWKENRTPYEWGTTLPLIINGNLLKYVFIRIFFFLFF